MRTVRAAAFALLAVLAASRAAAAGLSAPFVSAVSLGVSSAGWNWSLVSGATGYRVLSSTGGGNVSGDLPATATAFALTGMSTNTATAPVTIEAFGVPGTGDSSLISAYSAAATPSGTTLLGSNGTTASLSWAVNGNPAGTQYDVFWSSAGGTTVAFSTTPAVVGSSASTTIADLPTGFTLNFQVAALNGAGVLTPLDVVVSTTLPVLTYQPVMVATGTYALGVSSISWGWAGGVNVASYQLFADSGGAISPPLPASTTYYIQTGLTANTSYSAYVTATDGVGVSTNAAALTRYTLAAQTTGLALLSYANGYGIVGWGPNGNPAATFYNVSWWTGVTSTVTIATQAVTAAAGVLPAGGTVYFTVQAMNGEGILAAYDRTLFTAVPSTYFAVGVTTIPPSFSGVLTFAVPTGAIYLTMSSGTFATQATVSILTPAPSAVPGPTGRFSALPGQGVAFQITALDPFGQPLQPLLPIQIALNYLPGVLGGVDPSQATIARYDATFGQWVPLMTQRQAGSLAALSEHLTLFSVLGLAAPTDLTAVTVGPNPLRPDLNPGQVFTFRGVPAGARVRVFTILGQKVADLTADGSGLVTWDGRNPSSVLVGSGVYLAVLEGPGKRTFRLAVER